tara:strand:+ start:305 stop:415 length:111 start_codon:yes stop_codon:yes gene_type:complete
MPQRLLIGDPSGAMLGQGEIIESQDVRLTAINIILD